MKIKFTSIFLILIILLYLPTFAFMKHKYIYSEQMQNTDEHSIIIKNEIEANFKKINSFIADLEIIKNKAERITGRVFYKSTPYPRTKETWEFPGGEKAIKYTSKDYEIIYMPNTNIAIKNLEINKSLSDKTVLLGINFKKGGADEDKDYYYYDINLPIPDESLMTDEIPIKMKVLFNREYGYVSKTIFINRKGEELETQEFKNYQLNIPIEDKEFEFIPPKDCRIMFREEVIPSKPSKREKRDRFEKGTNK